MGKGDKQPRHRAALGEAAPKQILFSKNNYIIIGVGLLLVAIGFFVMSGGHNGPDEWNADAIYSFPRLTLAPIIILTGLSVVVVAIFKDNKGERIETVSQSEEA